MTEGTKSYLLGCHQFLLHPICVLLTWRLEYNSWPKWWEVICIFFHDIGICGRQYLSDDSAKHGHWKVGARLVWHILSYVDRQRPTTKRDWNATATKGYRLCAGHTQESGFPESKLARADKRSWLVAPMIWLWWNYWVEWYGTGVRSTLPPLWKKLVAANLAQEKPVDNHQLYIKHRQ